MLRHYKLHDEDYALIEDLLLKNGKRGGQWKDHRTTLNGILWILYTGGHRRELPERGGERWRVSRLTRRWAARAAAAGPGST